MSPYRMVVSEGHKCWLVFLDVPTQAARIVLGRANTEEEAIKLALEIRNGVLAS